MPLTDLKPDEFELAPMIYGSGRLEIVGSDRQGIRPILKIGQLELAGVMVARRIVDGPAYRVFEKIEGTIVIRRMVLSESDAALAKKSGLINCIRMALDDLRIKRDHQEKRESTHSAEDSRRETKQIAIDVMRDQVDAYRLNPEVATCLN